jgi:uncharacterized protein (DUF1330 family)
MNDPLPDSRLTLVVLLFVEPGRVDEFEEFERQAAAIMARHGGRIEQRIEVRTEGEPSRPHEVHIVSFPDEDALDRYRADPETRALAALREQVIRRTEIWPARRAKPSPG